MKGLEGSRVKPMKKPKACVIRCLPTCPFALMPDASNSRAFSSAYAATTTRSAVTSIEFPSASK